MLSSLPVLLILILMVGLRWNAIKAGAAGYLSALLIALLFFGAEGRALQDAHLKALQLALDVLVIIWAAYFLYRVSDEAGAIERIGISLRTLTADKGMQAILIGWVFASFLQGTGGFGVPVAVTAPLLVGLGFSPLTAVVIPTVGHGWAVTFGSLGSSFNALISSTGLSAAYLAPAAASFLGLACVLTGVMVVWILKMDAETEHAPPLGSFVTFVFKSSLARKAILIGAVMGAAQYLVAVVLGLWSIGSFAGGMAGLAAGVAIARRGQASPKQVRNGRSSLTKNTIRNALLPFSAYAALILYTFLSLFLPKSLFTHPGAILFYAALTAFFVYRRAGLYTAGAGKRILKQTGRKMLKSSLSILLMVAMAMVMRYAGMTEALARGLAQQVGKAYPLAAGWIGAMGAFMTGSNTNSNVLFAALQMRTAELLGYSVPIILAAQTAGAGLASVIAPAKLIVGASTAGMEGKEGEVMRALIGYIAVLLLFISLLTMLFSKNATIG